MSRKLLVFYLISHLFFLSILCPQGSIEQNDAPLIEREDNDTKNAESDRIDDGFWGAESSENDRPVSHTSGVAPLAVHFYSEFAAEGDKSEKFRNYDYTWNFGDAEDDVWGTTGKSKNLAKGAAAVHIFEHPGTYEVKLIVRGKEGIVAEENYAISVQDPDLYYSGEKTICVSDTVHADFSSAPAGALKIVTDDLSTIVKYALPNRRILFHRGSSWFTESLYWPDNEGPVLIDSFGNDSEENSLGNYKNAPVIFVKGERFLNLSNKQNWTIQNLHLISKKEESSGFVGSLNLNRILIKNMILEGFKSSIAWSHYNDNKLLEKNDIVISSCEILNSISSGIYGGSERLALLGNLIQDSQRAHVVRIWQAYRSVISNNIITGSSISTDSGMHALKFHGPGIYPKGGTSTLGEPIPGTSLKRMRTDYSIISDNVFGSSGPWPVAIGPQNGVADERITNIIIERNRFHPDYGNGIREVNLGIIVWGSSIAIRNNLFDGTGAGGSYYAIVVERRGVEPIPQGIEVYNNTIFRGDIGEKHHIGIRFGSQVVSSYAINNLISFPNADSYQVIDDKSIDIESLRNIFIKEEIFTDPNNSDPLSRNYICIDGFDEKGSEVPVFDDFSGLYRDYEDPGVGAYIY